MKLLLWEAVAQVLTVAPVVVVLVVAILELNLQEAEL
jgi:hypothetical protein